MATTAKPPYRPPMMTEVRAWLLVALTFVLQLIALVYWAASLSADIKNLQFQVTDFRAASADRYTLSQAREDWKRYDGNFADHEARIRRLELATSLVNGSGK